MLQDKGMPINEEELPEFDVEDSLGFEEVDFDEDEEDDFDDFYEDEEDDFELDSLDDEVEIK